MFDLLPAYLSEKLGLPCQDLQITPFPGGFSNLTYAISCEAFSYVLRRPPLGAKISKAHDMVREFKVLKALAIAGYTKMPRPILVCEDENIIGAPFFLMERIEGRIIRTKMPSDVGPSFFRKLSEQAMDVLIELHQLELENSGLLALGKPEGYVIRQVAGWSERYEKAKTDAVPDLEQAFDWLKANQPLESSVAFIHNDFKFDNLVCSAEADVLAVLDWEMATIGDPLMDLGTTLAYWAEPGDVDILKMFNLSYVEGNFTRAELVTYYASKTSVDMSHILFYYVFGLCKVAVIAQQIYQRYVQGFASDTRFAVLNQVVQACGQKAQFSIQHQTI